MIRSGKKLKIKKPSCVLEGRGQSLRFIYSDFSGSFPPEAGTKRNRRKMTE
jgi:hypothetical protein